MIWGTDAPHVGTVMLCHAVGPCSVMLWHCHAAGQWATADATAEEGDNNNRGQHQPQPPHRAIGEDDMMK